MSDPYLGEVRIFAGNFAPRGWAHCDGQLVPLAQNAALYALVGTAFGGDGTNNFGLPDLRGRVPMHWGNGPWLSPREHGATGGQESVPLTVAQIPQHNHPLQCATSPGNLQSPVSMLPAPHQEQPLYRTYGGVPMHAQAIKETGGNAAHNNLQPYLTLNFIIAMEGLYPRA